jgi:hypothetical protein
MQYFRLILLCAALIALAGCTSSLGNSFGGQGNVGIVDSSERAHHDTKLTGTDFVQFAEKVTDKMLRSPLISSWEGKRPKVVVGHLLNNTMDENLRIADIHDRIQEMLMASGVMRVMDSSSTSFDYVMKNTITSTEQGNSSTGEKLVNYTLMLKMYTIEGELVGQWSDDLVLAKGKRSVF